MFQEIEVVTTPSGKPEISVSGWAAKIAKKKKIDQCSVSISHSAHYAVASVILIGQHPLPNPPRLRGREGWGDKGTND
jgi:phosphopantetheinyl transferase (holo-ACP synthase)